MEEDSVYAKVSKSMRVKKVWNGDLSFLYISLYVLLLVEFNPEIVP